MGFPGLFSLFFQKTLAFPPQKLYTKSKELRHTFGFLAVFADATHPRKGTVTLSFIYYAHFSKMQLTPQGDSQQKSLLAAFRQQ